MAILPACGDAIDLAEAPPEGIDQVQHALSSISCSESKETGYKKGVPFAITVVTVDGKQVETQTANAYYVMAKAAAAAGVQIKVVSGFRTMASQTYLYNCYKNCNCNNCNLAATPGYSNHQSGHALDLNTSVSSVYNWLSAHGGAYGFKRTVPSEKWHWEWWGGGPGGGPCGSCTPTCKGSKIVGKDCGEGDCAVFGATCANDSKGVRCVSVFCPALGKKKVCVTDKLIGDCSDGAISTGDCSKYAAYCSTAGSTAGARCVSAFCVASAKEVPKAHAICLPDGKLAQCTDQGGLDGAKACATDETCVVESGGARCASTLPPQSDAGAPATDDAQSLVDPDVQPDSGAAPGWDAGVPLLAGDGAVNLDAADTLEGGCHLGGGSAGWPSALLLLALLALVRRVNAG